MSKSFKTLIRGFRLLKQFIVLKRSPTPALDGTLAPFPSCFERLGLLMLKKKKKKRILTYLAFGSWSDLSDFYHLELWYSPLLEFINKAIAHCRLTFLTGPCDSLLRLLTAAKYVWSRMVFLTNFS